MNLKYKKLTKTAKEPSRGSKYAAGYDLYADVAERVVLPPHSTVKIPTNIAMEIPDGYFGAVYARSGIASKRGLRPCNCVGIIDSDYRGNIMVALHNDTETTQTVEPDERIAQIIIQPYLKIEWEEADELNSTQRGSGGFGSTGR